MRASHALLLERPPFFSARGVCLASTVVDCRLAVLIHVTTVPLEREPPPFFCGLVKSIQFLTPLPGFWEIGTPLLTFINAIFVHQIEIFTVPPCFYLARSEPGVF